MRKYDLPILYGQNKSTIISSRYMRTTHQFIYILYLERASSCALTKYFALVVKVL